MTDTAQPGKAPWGMSLRYLLFRGTLRVLGRIFLGFTVHGARNTPESGPLVVASNHHRFFDPVFVCMAVPRRVQWMAKKELFVFGLRGFFALIGAFPVDRQGGGRSALRVALQFLKADGPSAYSPKEPAARKAHPPRQRAAPSFSPSAPKPGSCLSTWIGYLVLSRGFGGRNSTSTSASQ